LLQDAAAGKFEIALVVEMERFSRSRDGADLAVIKRVFRESGIRFGTPAQLFNPDDVEDDFISGLLGLLSSREKQKMIKRTQDGRLEASRRGLYMGRVPYRYRRHDGRLLIYEPEAQVVRDMFAWLVDQGMSIRGIATRLDVQGTPPRQGTRWNWSAVQYVLTNETYAGLARYNRMQRKGEGIKPESEWIAFPVPTIISQERYRQAQVQMRHNTWLQPGRRQRTYLLRGIVHCALCGQTLQGHPARGIPHYQCKGKRGPTPCATRITLAATLDRLVWGAVRRLVLHPDLVAAEVQRQRESRVTQQDEAEMRLACIRNALEKMPSERDRILRAYREGWISDADVKRQLDEIQRKREGLEAERRRLAGWLEGEAADERTRARLDEVFRRVRTRMGRLSDNERFEVVHAVIRDVRVDNQGGVEITSYLPEGKNRSGGPSGWVLTSSS
jgi:site-specific DNA recombinase